ncbi:hypothetical protein D3C85_848140 [compost metagenome]
MRQPIRHRGTTSGVHPHIQRTVSHEREAAFRIVDLRRRNTQIQHHAIDLADAELLQFFRHGGKAAMNDRDPGIRRRQRVGHGDCFGILVKDHQPRLLAQTAKQLAAVPATPEGAVDEDAALRSRSRIRLGLRMRPCRTLAAKAGQQ